MSAGHAIDPRSAQCIRCNVVGAEGACLVEVQALALEDLAARWEDAIAQFDYVATDEDRSMTKQWADNARDHARMLRHGEITSRSLAEVSRVDGAGVDRG